MSALAPTWGRNPKHLPESTRDAITRAYIAGDLTRTIAERFGIACSTVCRIAINRGAIRRDTHRERRIIHGSKSGYCYYGCRCVACTQANRQAAYQNRRKEKGLGRDDVIPAGLRRRCDCGGIIAPGIAHNCRRMA